MKLKIRNEMNVCGTCAYYDGNQTPADILNSLIECDDSGRCLEPTRRNFPMHCMQTCNNYKKRF